MLTYKHKSKLTTKTLQHRPPPPSSNHPPKADHCSGRFAFNEKGKNSANCNIEIGHEKVNSHQTTKNSRGKGLQGAIEPDKGHTRVRADKQQPQAPHLTGAKSGMNTWCPCHAPA